MSGLLLCNKQSDKPYHISELDIHVYSIEEISYFLYNHICLVGMDFFGYTLVDYIKINLELTELADTLKRMIDQRASFHEMVLLIIRESNYYVEEEIKELSNTILTLGTSSLHKRLKAKGDILFTYNKYVSALSVYKKILDLKREPDLPMQFYANIQNNIASIYIRLFCYKDAFQTFALAYEIYPDETYLKRLVLVAIMYNDEENLLKSIKKYNISDEILTECRHVYMREKEQAQNQEEYNQLKDLLYNNANQERNAYYKGLLDTIDKWKSDYRELMI